MQVELGTGRVLCVQTQLRRGEVCRARVVAACPWNPRPGDPQRSLFRAGAAAAFPERPGPVLSRALMQKSPGGWLGHLSPTLGPGATWPPPTTVRVGVRCGVGGCAPGQPGPGKRSDPQMVGTFLLQVAALKPPVSAGHGQRWEGQDGAETGVAAAPGASPGQPLPRPRPWCLWNARPLGPHPRGRVTTCHTSEVTLPGDGEGRPETRVSCRQKP